MQLFYPESQAMYGQRFMTLYRRQGSRPSPWKRNARKQNGCLWRPSVKFSDLPKRTPISSE